MERCSCCATSTSWRWSLWVGGLVVAGALVAPSVFGVLQAWNAVAGRVLAGQVFGEVLLRLTWLSYAMAAVMFVTLTLHRLLGARPLRYGIRVGIMAVMLVMMMITGFYLIPQVERDPGAGGGTGLRNCPTPDRAARRVRSPARALEHPLLDHGHRRSGTLLVGSAGITTISRSTDLRLLIDDQT